VEFGNVILGKSDMLVGNFLQQHITYANNCYAINKKFVLHVNRLS